ncbi:MAG: hypothetical protein B7X36_14740, partial [Thiomonas sp. 14-64-326]
MAVLARNNAATGAKFALRQTPHRPLVLHDKLNCGTFTLRCGEPMSIEQARFNMIEQQIRPW